MKLMFDQLKNEATTTLKKWRNSSGSTDQALFSFRFENNIPAGERECMRTAKIGPDLRLILPGQICFF